MKLSSFLAVCLLGAQLFGIARMPFVEDRFFCWSPHDSRTDFRILAYHNGSQVPEPLVQARYRLPAIEWHNAGNVKQVIRTAELRQPPEQRWQVRVTYRINLGPEQVWHHPGSQ